VLLRYPEFKLGVILKTFPQQNKLSLEQHAFISPDGTRPMFRTARPATPEGVEEFKALMTEGFVKPKAGS